MLRALETAQAIANRPADRGRRTPARARLRALGGPDLRRDRRPRSGAAGPLGARSGGDPLRPAANRATTSRSRALSFLVDLIAAEEVGLGWRRWQGPPLAGPGRLASRRFGGPGGGRGRAACPRRRPRHLQPDPALHRAWHAGPRLPAPLHPGSNEPHGPALRARRRSRRRPAGPRQRRRPPSESRRDALGLRVVAD